MKNSSIFQVLLLAGFGALAAAGVLVFSLAVGGGNSANTIGPITIWGDLDRNAFQAVIQQLGQDNPQLAQVTYVQQDPATYDKTLSDALASGTGPDLFILSSDDAVKDAGKVMPIPYTQLTRQQFQSAFVEAADVYLGKDGVLGVPFAVDPLVLYWNKDVLASAGYATPPTLWSDVAAMVPKIVQKNSVGDIRRGAIAIGTSANVGASKEILSAMIMQAGGDVTALDRNGNLVSALITNTGQDTGQPAVNAISFYTEFADPAQSMYSWNGSFNDARAAFAAGDVAMYVGFASEAPIIAALNPNLNFADAPLPQISSSGTFIDAGRAYAFAVPRVAKRPQNSVTAAFLLNVASSSAALSQALGIPSASRAVIASGGGTSDLVFNGMALITRTWSDPDPAQTGAIFQSMINDTISGAATPLQAAQRANQQMQQLITQ